MNLDVLKSRQAKSGSYMVAYILVFAAILVAVNYLGVRYNKTYDATENKLYSLSDQSVKISTVRGKLRQRTVSLYRSMYYGLFSPGTI